MDDGWQKHRFYNTKKCLYRRSYTSIQSDYSVINHLITNHITVDKTNQYYRMIKGINTILLTIILKTTRIELRISDAVEN